MKPGILFACCLTLIAPPALAALDANDCVSQGMKQMPSKRDAYVASCMAQVSSSANTNKIKQKNKSATCEQNAKNHRLQGNAKVAYISKCMTADEAATASAKLASAPKTTLPWLAEKNETKKQPPRHRSEKSCAQRAEKLKGNERKHFMKRCK